MRPVCKTLVVLMVPFGQMQIYSSDEGRVQVTAAAFARGLLQLDNDIPPILASLVRKDSSVNKLLDDVGSAKDLVSC